MEHRLVIDYRAGRCEARCSCGRWHETPAPSPVSRIRQVYPRLEAGHRRHVAAVGSGVGTPTRT